MMDSINDNELEKEPSSINPEQPDKPKAKRRTPEEKMANIDARIKKAQEKLEKAQAKKQSLQKNIDSKKRKIDTRQKIILGGWLTALIKRLNGQAITKNLDLPAFLEAINGEPMPEQLKAWIAEQINQAEGKPAQDHQAKPEDSLNTTPNPRQ